MLIAGRFPCEAVAGVGAADTAGGWVCSVQCWAWVERVV